MADNTGGVDRKQQDELRHLAALHQAGHLSDAEYQEKRRRIATRAAAVLATSRGADGATLDRALTVEKSLNPLIIKGAIAVVILAVLAQVGWIVVRKVAAYEPTLAPEPVAVAPPPAPVPPRAPASPSSAAPVRSPAGAPSAVAPAAPVVVEEAAAIVEDVAPPAEEAATEESPAAEPPAPPQVLVVAWDVPYPEHEATAGHPFRQWCGDVRYIEAGRVNATIGVKLGPEASGLDDAAYAAFRDELRKEFEQRIVTVQPGLSFKAIPTPVRTGRVMAERFTGANPQSTAVAVLVTTVQDGRAFAYYFSGANMLLRQFNDAVGLAKATPPAAPASAAEESQAG